jgi:hypothetical protein
MTRKTQKPSSRAAKSDSVTYSRELHDAAKQDLRSPDQVIVECPDLLPADEERVHAAVAALTELFAEWLRRPEHHQQGKST